MDQSDLVYAIGKFGIRNSEFGIFIAPTLIASVEFLVSIPDSSRSNCLGSPLCLSPFRGYFAAPDLSGQAGPETLAHVISNGYNPDIPDLIAKERTIGSDSNRRGRVRLCEDKEKFFVFLLVPWCPGG